MDDLQQLISAKTHLCYNPQLPEPQLLQHCTSAVAAAAAPPSINSYDPSMVGDSFYSRGGFTQFAHDYSSSTPATKNTTTVASDHDATAFCSLEAAEKGWFGFDAGNNRWPRQETLSLLEIRSRLDSKFRESNPKGPLWNEISRIMLEEYGYQRSGKKCKEKFENLYKYYKKTKEAKTGKQDRNHYRFFHQLEAIYGETNTHHASTTETHQYATNTLAPHQTPTSTSNQNTEVFSLSKSSEFETSSSENNEEDLSAIASMIKQSREKQKGVVEKRSQSKGGSLRRKSWRVKVEEIVESHMRKIIEAQDTWMKRVLSVVEQREKEMVSKEEERKKKESKRFDQEVYELWAKERAWVEARDAALMEAVKKHIGREFKSLPLEPLSHKTKSQGNDAKEYLCEAADNDHSRRWSEMEISILIHLRTGFEQRFPENYGYLENGVWDDIAAKMVGMGFDRNATECKQIWDEISISLSRTVECSSNFGLIKRQKSQGGSLGKLFN